MTAHSSHPYKEEILAICEKYKDQDLTVDVLRGISESSRLMGATEHLRELIHRDPTGLFEKEDYGAKLVGEGARLSSLLHVTSLDNIRSVDGNTTIDACVNLEPRTSSTSTVQFQFHFRRRPCSSSSGGMRMMEEDARGGEACCGSSCEHGNDGHQHQNTGQTRKRSRRSAGHGDSDEAGSSSSSSSSAKEEESSGDDEEEEQEEEEEEGDDGQEALEPTTIIEYVITANRVPSLTPPVEIIHVMIHGMSKDGSPSPSGVRGPDDIITPEDEEAEEKFKSPHDFALAVVDDEALIKVRRWTKTTLGPVEFLLFLMSFPYWEEEWDVLGIVMDQVCGTEEEEYEDEEEEEVAAKGTSKVVMVGKEKQQQQKKKKKKVGLPPPPPVPGQKKKTKDQKAGGNKKQKKRQKNY